MSNPVIHVRRGTPRTEPTLCGSLSKQSVALSNGRTGTCKRCRAKLSADPASTTPAGSDVMSMIPAAAAGVHFKVRQSVPGRLMLGLAGAGWPFTYEAARQIALEILRRIPETPERAAILTAGWTGSHYCGTGDPGCLHFTCSRCGASAGSGPGRPWPVHKCPKVQP